MRGSTPGPARQTTAQNEKRDQAAGAVFSSAEFQERSPYGSRAPRHAISLDGNESAAQLLSGRQLVQAVELDNGHIFLVFDRGLHFGIRGSGLQNFSHILGAGIRKIARGGSS